MRQIHRSHYIQRLNRVIDYIQRHPDGDLSLSSLAAVAHFSPFHFHRIFRTHTDRTLKAFVAQSRLDRALFVMRTSPRKRLAQVAVDCGFDSSSAFSKAFRKAYGVSPSKADLDTLLRSKVKAVTKANHHLAVAKTKHAWRVRIKARDAMQLAYVRVTGGYLKPQMLIDGYLRLQAWIDEVGISRESSLLLGMSMDDPDIVPLEMCRYDFCCTLPHKIKVADDIGLTTLPATRWATLHCVGDLTTVDGAWTHLFRDWLPASGWQAAPLPAIEIFNQRPEVIGWDRFDLDCCLPVVPLSIS